MSSNSYVVAGCRSWNRQVFDELIVHYPGKWNFVSSPEELHAEMLKNISPHYIFFLHWSWKVPPEFVENYECVCFHMTDLPYGRGGSPLQNLIIRGHYDTKLTALRMNHELDAGPIYLKKDLSLEGFAQQIYIRATYLAAEMIKEIITKQLKAEEQVGKPTFFTRRKPEESKITNLKDLRSLYDFIRMLDADGYPHAFLEHEGFRYQFSNSRLLDGKIVANVTVVSKGVKI